MLRAMLVYALLCTSALGQSAAAPQVDTGSVLRMGDSTTRTGDGIQADETETAIMAATDVPPDDNHKWFVSILTMNGCAPCKALEKQWNDAANRQHDERTLEEGDAHLLAWGNPLDTAKSWSHFNFYNTSIPIQGRRFKEIRVTAYPTVLLQPPLNGKYGDAATVVAQFVYPGDPKKMSDLLSAYQKAYIARLPKQASGGGFGQVAQEAGRQPDRPLPPVMTPSTPATPSPSVPDSPFPVLPPDAVPAPPVAPVAPVTPSTPAHPADEEIVVVNDGNGDYDLLTDSRVLRAISSIEANAGKKLRVRIVDRIDALKNPDLAPHADGSQFPMILHLRNKQVVTKLSSGFLGMFKGFFSNVYDSTLGFFVDLWWWIRFIVFLLCFGCVIYVCLMIFGKWKAVTSPVGIATTIAEAVAAEVAKLKAELTKPEEPKP